MRRVLWLTLCLLAAVPARADPATGTGTFELSPDSEARWVAFDLTAGNQMRFTATLDGKPVTAILDTGASHSVLAADYARRTGLRVAQRGATATAIGGEVARGWAGTTLIEFGGLSRAGGGIDVVELPVRTTGERALDIIAGRDLIDRYALDIDYANRRFRLLPSGRLPYVGVQAPLRVAQAPLAYVTRLTVAGRRVEPVIVDTGDGTSLTLSREAWRALPLAPAPPETTALAYGVGGAIQLNLSSLPRVALGGLSLDDVEVGIERSGGFLDAAKSAGRIGMGFLQRFRVLLDPAAGHMVLAPAASAATPPRSTTGLQLALEHQRLTVLHVMRGSPADAGGWKAGETICTVDGTSVATAGAAAGGAGWPFGTPGRTVALGLCDGSTRTLTLRRFY